MEDLIMKSWSISRSQSTETAMTLRKPTEKACELRSSSVTTLREDRKGNVA